MIELWNAPGTPLTVVLIGITIFLSLIFLIILTKPTREDRDRDETLREVRDSLITLNELPDKVAIRVVETLVASGLKESMDALKSTMDILIIELQKWRGESENHDG